ncbi:MAG TPA: hypothetical protein VFB79_12905, partial [Candidatus Angelobacter sp.]|nr:hypothetical protein [Candidatus Angelobacter sp.]
NALHYARPAYLIYLACRTIATYAIFRKRYHFLSAVLPKYVRLFTIDNNATISEPLLFWPFRGAAVATDMRQGGRNQALWEDHIARAWGHHFGNFESFLNAASQLEFILEFNSYLFEGIQNPQIKLIQQLGNKSMAYLPDFWTNRLDPTVPIAELFYDILREQRGLPNEFMIDKRAGDLVFAPLESQDRLIFLGGFLSDLKTWQGQVMMQQNRFPFTFDWPGRLKEIVKAYKARQKPPQ